MQRVVEFLGIRASSRVFGLSHKNINTWIKSSNYKEQFVMPPGTRKMLKEFFEPYNQMLAQLLNDSGYLWKDV